ncbi:MAG: hypothetical protein HC814_01400 [Rhodobacteraceae bacterium]|nr:hypothetical protein [Paracoccaceae bacterium]
MSLHIEMWRWVLVGKRNGMAFLVWIAGMTMGMAGLQAAGDSPVPADRLPDPIATAIGVFRNGEPIPALIEADDLNFDTPKTRILLVGGLDNSSISDQTIQAATRWFFTAEDAQPFRRDFTLSAVRCSDDSQTDEVHARPASFPPRGAAYADTKSPAASYLWRWIGMHAPDCRATGIPQASTNAGSSVTRASGFGISWVGPITVSVRR